jgi:uncharacterized RDD family membrane protein YckC
LDIFNISTSQNVTIQFNLASVGERAVAWVIDLAIMLSLYGLGFDIFSSGFNISITENSYGILLVLLPILLYHFLFEWLGQGASPGKRLMKLKVVMQDGSSPSLGAYAARHITRPFEFLVVPGLAFLVYLFSGTGQRLGDMLAQTLVVRNQNRVQLKSQTVKALPDDYKPVFKAAQNLRPSDIQIVRDVAKIYMESLNPKILAELREQMEATLNTQSELKDIPYIQQVVNDYTWFQQQQDVF